MVTDKIMTLPKHLGGHYNKTHIDEESLSYLIERYDIKSMYDVGCGTGGMVKIAKEKGIEAVGIDGDFTVKYPPDIEIIIHDFTNGPLDCTEKHLSWSCEFLEHVEEKFMDNYFSVFKKTNIVCCTFCNLKGKGHHHVNVQNQEYWDEKFLLNGFKKDIDSTSYIREHSSMVRDFVRNTGTVYINQRIKK